LLKSPACVYCRHRPYKACRRHSHSYASPGTGTPPHLVGELFRLSLGLDLVHERRARSSRCSIATLLRSWRCRTRRNAWRHLATSRSSAHPNSVLPSSRRKTRGGQKSFETWASRRSNAAATGFRAFLPMLIVSGAAYTGHLPLGNSFAWRLGTVLRRGVKARRARSILVYLNRPA
jgi:hypothetical protein